MTGGISIVEWQSRASARAGQPAQQKSAPILRCDLEAGPDGQRNARAFIRRSL